MTGITNVTLIPQNDLSNENFVKRLVNYNDSLGYRLYEGIKNLTNSSDRAKQIEYNFLKAFRDSGTNSNNRNFVNGNFGYQYSVNDNGTTYADSNGTTIFDAGNSYSELEPYIDANDGNKAKGLRNYLLDNYKGKLINVGNIYDADFNAKSAREYAYPANRRLKQDILDVKKTISVDLGDIALKAQFLGTKENTRPNKKSDYYDYFKVSFGIDDGSGVEYYDGILNVEVANDKPLFYDITQIKRSNRTPALPGSVTPSTNNISNNKVNVNQNSIGLNSNTPDIQNLKQKQLDIVLNSNPAFNDSSTWIRSIDDIKTYEETLSDSDYANYLEDGFTPDYSADMAKEALDTGKMKVYSSYPIENGTWVTPSRMEAESYSGNGQVYSKEIDLDDVAWVDPTQGMYAKTKTDNDAKHSVGLKSNIPNKDVLDTNYTPEEMARSKKGRDYYNSDMSVEEFFDKFSGIPDQKVLWLGKLKSDFADRVKKDTGIDLTGRSLTLTNQALTHIENRHGINNYQKHGNPSPITSNELNNLAYILDNYDNVRYIDEGSQGKKLEFITDTDGGFSYLTVEMVPTRRKQLAIKTMYSISKKERANRVADTVNNTAPTLTSANNSDGSLDALSTDNISNNKVGVN